MMNAPSTDIDCSWRCKSKTGFNCGLLQELTGTRDDASCAVDESTCRDCLRWYPPSQSHLNPVVASLLYRLCTDIAGAGGTDDCSVGQASQLKRQATQAIPFDYDADPVTRDIHEQTNIDVRDIGTLIPRPVRRYGSKVTRWAVAVTTAPREQETLDDCLGSLIQAGWTDPRLFVDGDVSVSQKWNHLETTYRKPQMGAWPNYYLTLAEMFMRHPDADAYMLVQDDVVFFRHPDVREYVESVLWPSADPGIVCLFCSRGHAPADRGWHPVDGRLVWGGPAMIYSRPVLMNLLSDPGIIAHRLSNDGRDSTSRPVGTWALETGTNVTVCAPSLVQHVGHVSSLFPGVKAFSCRSAAEFAGTCSVQNNRS